MIIIWKDILDEQTYHLGVRTSNNKVVLWATIFADGLYDLFGNDFSEWAKSIEQGYYHEINLTASPAKG